MKRSLGVLIALCIAVPGSARASDETVRTAPYDFSQACEGASGGGHVSVLWHQIGPSVGADQRVCHDDEQGRRGILTVGRSGNYGGLGVLGTGFVWGAENGREYHDTGVFSTPPSSGTLAISADIGQAVGGVMLLGIRSTESLSYVYEDAHVGTIEFSASVVGGTTYRIWVQLTPGCYSCGPLPAVPSCLSVNSFAGVCRGALTVDRIRYTLDP